MKKHLFKLFKKFFKKELNNYLYSLNTHVTAVDQKKIYRACVGVIMNREQEIIYGKKKFLNLMYNKLIEDLKPYMIIETVDNDFSPYKELRLNLYVVEKPNE
jgi:hypothetical protein